MNSLSTPYFLSPNIDRDFQDCSLEDHPEHYNEIVISAKSVLHIIGLVVFSLFQSEFYENFINAIF